MIWPLCYIGNCSVAAQKKKKQKNSGCGRCQSCPGGHVPDVFVSVIQNFTPAKRANIKNDDCQESESLLKRTLAKDMTLLLRHASSSAQYLLSHTALQWSFARCSIHPRASFVAPHWDALQVSRIEHVLFYSVRYWWPTSFWLKWPQNMTVSSAFRNDFQVCVNDCMWYQSEQLCVQNCRPTLNLYCSYKTMSSTQLER